MFALTLTLPPAHEPPTSYVRCTIALSFTPTKYPYTLLKTHETCSMIIYVPQFSIGLMSYDRDVSNCSAT